MGVMTCPSTISGGYTPICNTCGTTLCWDISEQQYAEERDFWDAWQCRDCNPRANGARRRWLATHTREATSALPPATLPVSRG